MRLLDHIYDDQFVENAVVRIILPEHTRFIILARKIKLFNQNNQLLFLLLNSDIKCKTPYGVEKRPDTLHYTYLDVTGRPVIEVRKVNTVDNHIQDFEVMLTIVVQLFSFQFFHILLYSILFTAKLQIQQSHDCH